MSRERERDRRRPGRSRRSRSIDSTGSERFDSRADARKGSKRHRDIEYRRRSRSPSYHRRPSPDRRPSPPPPSSARQADRKGHSRSPSPRREKRHRSIQRYAPAARRRRNSSSVTPPAEKRRKTADFSGDVDDRKVPRTNAEAREEPPRVTAATANEEVGRL